MLSYNIYMSKKNKNTLIYKAKELLITDNRKYLKCNWSDFTQSLISTLENTTKVKITLETYPLFKESLKSLFASFYFNQIKTNKKLALYSNIKSIYSTEPYLKIKILEKIFNIKQSLSTFDLHYLFLYIISFKDTDINLISCLFITNEF